MSAGNDPQRERALEHIHANENRDVLVIGGGITGAGILREAARRGLSALLVEQRDFAWGTSSRSSQMVHGGLRYLLSADVALTRASVRERQRLLQEAPELVRSCGYLFLHRRRQRPGPGIMRILLRLYDFFAGTRDYRFVTPPELLMQAPGLQADGLTGATGYSDALTDDARLVWRVLAEARAAGAHAVNYMAVTALTRDRQGEVNGATLHDATTGRETTINAKVVINATGAWADQLNQSRHIRPLRGSHLVLPAWRLPVAQCVTFLHPSDRRGVFVYPWQGCTVIGTTDLDHEHALSEEAAVSAEEITYLLGGVNRQFPGARLQPDDIQATWSGVRPVIAGGRRDPSSERRTHSVWRNRGLITVSGGKLTTFRLIALDALAAAAERLPAGGRQHPDDRIFDPPAALPPNLPSALAARLIARYGASADAVLDRAREDELAPVAHTPVRWLEIREAARNEAVVHLDDLLLRRTRLGLLLPEGGAAWLAPIMEIVAAEKGWDAQRQQQELHAWHTLYRTCYSVPASAATTATENL